MSPAARELPANAATRTREASHRIDTCNVVIFGATGAGKSSVVNLITGGRYPVGISPDGMRCTPVTTPYDHDIVTVDKTLRVKLFDTPGLDGESDGVVPAEEVLKKLFHRLKEEGGTHLLMYCVMGGRKAMTLRRNYDLVRSVVKNVPIVLVVAGLENQEPSMEEWWTKNEIFLSGQKMTFAGHACITAVILKEDDGTGLRERRKESYLAIRKLIERHRLLSVKGVHGYVGDHHGIDHPRNVVVCDSAIPAPMNVYNITGVTNGAWVKTMAVIHEQYYAFQRVTAPYPPVGRSKRCIDFQPNLLIFYVDRNLAVDTQKTKVQEFFGVYAKINVDLIVVVYGSDSDEDANSWWNGSNANSGPFFKSSINFRLTYLIREALGYSRGSKEVLERLI